MQMHDFSGKINVPHLTCCVVCVLLRIESLKRSTHRSQSIGGDRQNEMNVVVLRYYNSHARTYMQRNRFDHFSRAKNSPFSLLAFGSRDDAFQLQNQKEPYSTHSDPLTQKRTLDIPCSLLLLLLLLLFSLFPSFFSFVWRFVPLMLCCFRRRWRRRVAVIFFSFATLHQACKVRFAQTQTVVVWSNIK